MKSHVIGREKAGQTLIAMWHPKHAKYAFYSPTEFKDIERQIAALPQSRAFVRVLQRLTLGTAQEVVVDKNGTVELQDYGEDVLGDVLKIEDGNDYPLPSQPKKKGKIQGTSD